MYSSRITVIWHAQSQLVGFVLRLYMYSSGKTVIWHAQSQLVGFLLRLYMYSSGITVIWHAQSQLVDFVLRLYMYLVLVYPDFTSTFKYILSCIRLNEFFSQMLFVF